MRNKLNPLDAHPKVIAAYGNADGLQKNDYSGDAPAQTMSAPGRGIMLLN